MSEASHNLHRETEAAKVLREQIADIIGDDEQCAADMVEAETSLNEAIDQAVRKLVLDCAAINGLEEMIKGLKSRQDRIADRIATMRAAIAAAMEQAGRKTAEHPACTLSLRAVPPSVVVTDEAEIPSAFWIPQPPKLSKKAVIAALKAKEDIPGAQLSNGGQTLQIKWN